MYYFRYSLFRTFCVVAIGGVWKAELPLGMFW